MSIPGPRLDQDAPNETLYAEKWHHFQLGAEPTDEPVLGVKMYILLTQMEPNAILEDFDDGHYPLCFLDCGNEIDVVREHIDTMLALIYSDSDDIIAGIKKVFGAGELISQEAATVIREWLLARQPTDDGGFLLTEMIAEPVLILQFTEKHPS
jgi:hypothetical protein